MEFVIIAFFLIFAFFDAIAQIPKYVGGALSLGGVAFTISNIFHTVKRIFVVSYPPLVAIYLLNATLASLFKVIVICYIGAAITAAIVFFKRRFFQRLLARQIVAFGSGGSMWKLWTWDVAPDLSSFNKNGTLPTRIWVAPKLFFSALWIYFFFGSVYFLINILGYIYKDYSSVILQMTGFLNAVGTIILAFYLDPVLARIFERDRPHADLALKSVLMAQIFNFGVVSPVFFLSLAWLLS